MVAAHCRATDTRWLRVASLGIPFAARAAFIFVVKTSSTLVALADPAVSAASPTNAVRTSATETMAAAKRLRPDGAADSSVVATRGRELSTVRRPRFCGGGLGPSRAVLRA